jgi:hypothetical protein
LKERFSERLSFSFRPSFMTVTIAVALLATPSLGFLAERLNDEQAVAAARAEDADRAIREQMLEQGFQPLDGLEAAAALRSSLGVELLAASRAFRLDLLTGPLTGSPPDEATVRAVSELVRAELSRYPRAFFGASRLRRVILCADLHEGSLAIPSLPNYHATLLLDVGSSSEFLKRLLHHELFHFVDYADDDQLQRDPEWEKLNDHFFSYGSGGRFLREPGSARFEPDGRGFVSKYSRSALEEDKAEIFAFLMTKPRAMAELAERDRVVATKILRVKSQVIRLLPALDERFWTTLR